MNMATSTESLAVLSDSAAQAALMSAFTQAFSDFNTASLDVLADLYHPEVVFTDPVQSVAGWSNLRAYFSASCENLQYCRFEFQRQLIAGDQACLQWVMHYSHKRIAGGAHQSLPGVSWILFTDRVVRHEDYYDMGALIYEKLPLLGAATGWIKQRMRHGAAQ